MSNPVFIQKNIQNNRTNAIKGMSLKDSTSDNTSDFELGRTIYNKTYSPPLTDEDALRMVNPPHFGQSGTSRIRPTMFDGTHTPNQKKWMGSANRDSSQITRNRRTDSVGKGSFNLPIDSENQTLSFTNGNDRNLINHTLSRVRGGGAVAPPKKAASPSNTYVTSPGNHPYLQPGFKGKIPGYFPLNRNNIPVNTINRQFFKVSPGN